MHRSNCCNTCCGGCGGYDGGCGGCGGCDGGCGAGGYGAGGTGVGGAVIDGHGMGVGGATVPGNVMPQTGEQLKTLPKDAAPGNKLPADKDKDKDNKGEVKSPGVNLTPASSNTIETETKNPFELDRRYETRVGRAADYSSMTGQLFYVHADGGLWVLRYAPLWQEDPNGGSVILARDRQMDSYREGDLVKVQGEILNPKGSIFLGGPLYRAQSIELIDRNAR
jgi:hypothetical protein